MNDFINLPKIMGVINANEDSFFKNSRFEGLNAIVKIENMIENGAQIIDIGGVSSRPGSIAVSAKEELTRVKPIIDLIYEQKLFEKIKFSLDSYQPEVLRYALDKGFKIVNDITGLQNDEVCEVASSFKASVVIMHMQNSPQNMQDNPKYNNVILDVDNFFKNRIKKAKSYGLKNIILDIGIGFGKSLDHNLILLKNLKYFKHLNCELLVGASRKSMINNIVKSEIDERIPGTLAIHLKSIENGANIIRCHDVKEHFQAIKVQEAINKAKIL
ncbi:MAG: dihydropteroate synthase [Arcobacter sp.]|nr:dihydropteroate synthase [Arcobacter sp.]